MGIALNLYIAYSNKTIITILVLPIHEHGGGHLSSKNKALRSKPSTEKRIQFLYGIRIERSDTLVCC
jgi:hypothetical protein